MTDVVLPPACACTVNHHVTRFVAITGGPGAGKTAVLNLAKHAFCRHVRALPEVATMLFAGGFPRLPGDASVRAAQRAIFSVQRELERVVEVDGSVALALCDRGTLDGLAYWPGDVDDFFSAHATDRATELARYAAVIHLHTPRARYYNHDNAARTETAAEARRMDAKIEAAWAGHPHVHFIDSTDVFLDKMTAAFAAIAHVLPACCAVRAGDSTGAHPRAARPMR